MNIIPSIKDDLKNTIIDDMKANVIIHQRIAHPIISNMNIILSSLII